MNLKCLFKGHVEAKRTIKDYVAGNTKVIFYCKRCGKELRTVTIPLKYERIRPECLHFKPLGRKGVNYGYACSLTGEQVAIQEPSHNALTALKDCRDCEHYVETIWLTTYRCKICGAEFETTEWMYNCPYCLSKDSLEIIKSRRIVLKKEIVMMESVKGNG